MEEIFWQSWMQENTGEKETETTRHVELTGETAREKGDSTQGRLTILEYVLIYMYMCVHALLQFSICIFHGHVHGSAYEREYMHNWKCTCMHLHVHCIQLCVI